MDHVRSEIDDRSEFRGIKETQHGQMDKRTIPSNQVADKIVQAEDLARQLAYGGDTPPEDTRHDHNPDHPEFVGSMKGDGITDEVQASLMDKYHMLAEEAAKNGHKFSPLEMMAHVNQIVKERMDSENTHVEDDSVEKNLQAIIDRIH